MLNTLRRVTSEGSFKISNFFESHLEGSPSSLRRGQNKLNSQWGRVVSTSSVGLVENFR